MLNAVVTWPIAWLGLAYCHHLLFTFLLKFHLETSFKKTIVAEILAIILMAKVMIMMMAIIIMIIILMANIIIMLMVIVIMMPTSTVVAATACFSSWYSIRQISACSTTENLNLGFCQTSIESEIIKVTEAPFYTILFAFSYMKYLKAPPAKIYWLLHKKSKMHSKAKV